MNVDRREATVTRSKKGLTVIEVLCAMQRIDEAVQYYTYNEQFEVIISEIMRKLQYCCLVLGKNGKLIRNPKVASKYVGFDVCGLIQCCQENDFYDEMIDWIVKIGEEYYLHAERFIEPKPGEELRTPLALNYEDPKKHVVNKALNHSNFDVWYFLAKRQQTRRRKPNSVRSSKVEITRTEAFQLLKKWYETDKHKINRAKLSEALGTSRQVVSKLLE